MNTKELKNYISDNLIDKEYVYCGMPLVRDYKDSDKKINFLSGAGIILNKKTTQLILDKRNNWDHSEWEDVSLGNYLMKMVYHLRAAEGKIFNIISITMLLTKQIITTGVDLTIITDTQDFWRNLYLLIYTKS